MKKHEQRPLVLYVEEIDMKPNLPEHGERVTVVDIEITEQMAIKIISELKKRLENEVLISSIRFRLSGKITLP